VAAPITAFPAAALVYGGLGIGSVVGTSTIEAVRILLDAKDLINLVEHDTPLSLNDFANWLNIRNPRLVLTAMNISELVAPLKRGGDFLEIRVLLQALERSPVCFLRETYIVLQELQSAIEAFRAGTEFQMPDPYVVRWDEFIHPCLRRRSYRIPLNS
jgi:hypothetical protein